MTYTIKFHGVACFSVSCDDTLLVFDPHNGTSMNLPVPTIRNANLILCTHKHYDHNNGVDLVKSDNAMILQEQEGDYQYGSVEIHGTRVRHGGDPSWGTVVVYTVRFPSGLVFIHGGDMGYVPNEEELEEILCFGQPEIAILPIGGFYCLDAKQATETAKLLKPKKTCIVCHYLYGPLLTREDFQGMTTEQPFMELVGKKCLILKKDLDSSQRVPEYVLFYPKL